MIELERVEREITRTRAGIRRSWHDLGGLNMPLEKRVAEIVRIDANQRHLVELLARREELHPSA
jgi:hypothetical protein